MSDEIKIKLSQIYLEIARSFIYSSVRSRKFEDILNDEEFKHDQSTFIFGMASVTSLYSYMAIESFINYGLYELWKHSRSAKKSIDEANQLYPGLNAVPIYKDFYDKYGKLDDFTEIKNTKLKELKERVKTLCKEFNYSPIHEVNPQLWTDFTGLLENARHFLVHPNPEQEEFHKLSKQLVQDISLFIKYPEVAADIISYFYTSAKKEVPAYLTSNKIFIINEMVLLK
jgi:hypothetical protein